MRPQLGRPRSSGRCRSLPKLAGVLSPVARAWLSEQGATFKPTTLDRDALAGG